jgi:pimeloyl-ACP methyl ester carboxylesterase
MKLFYRKLGSGPPFMILHGLYGSSDNWMTVAKSISSKFTVIIPDLRNHGRSSHSSEHNYDVMASDIRELAEELDIRKFILAGHSMGGRVAVRYALNWPESLYSLIVIDITPFGTRDPQNKIFRFHIEIIDCIMNSGIEGMSSRTEAERILSERVRSEKIRGLLMKNLHRDSNGTFKWKLNAESLLRNLPFIMDGACGKEKECPPATGFPVIFVRGDESDYIQLSDTELITGIFPLAEIITVEKAGHWVHADRPDAITDIFMNQLE